MLFRHLTLHGYVGSAYIVGDSKLIFMRNIDPSRMCITVLKIAFLYLFTVKGDD